MLTQHITKLAHQLATARGRHLAPQVKSMLGTGHVLLGFGRTLPLHDAYLAAINGRMHGVFALLVQRGVHP